MSINADSLDGGVAGGVSAAIGVSVRATGNCFGVEGGVGMAATAFGVDLAYSLGVVIAVTAGTAFDVGFDGFFRGGVGGVSIAFGEGFAGGGCTASGVGVFGARSASTQGHVGE